jgi:hypothetical protein
MTLADDTIFADILARSDRLLAQIDRVDDPVAEANALLRDAEEVIASWVTAQGGTPTDETVEGFRLLALHRQGARGAPTFNACRETAREVVFLRNVVLAAGDDPAQARHHLRLQAMVLRHLALFVGGKLHEAGLGDFCCSSRPLRSAAAETAQLNAPLAGAR